MREFSEEVERVERVQWKLRKLREFRISDLSTLVPAGRELNDVMWCRELRADSNSPPTPNASTHTTATHNDFMAELCNEEYVQQVE